MKILVRNSDNQIAMSFIENQVCDAIAEPLSSDGWGEECYQGQFYDGMGGTWDCIKCNSTGLEYREEHVNT
jgi:hypothetical protein